MKKRNIARICFDRDFLADVSANVVGKILSKLDDNTEILDWGYDPLMAQTSIVLWNPAYPAVSDACVIPQIDVKLIDHPNGDNYDIEVNEPLTPNFNSGGVITTMSIESVRENIKNVSIEGIQRNNILYVTDDRNAFNDLAKKVNGKVRNVNKKMFFTEDEIYYEIDPTENPDRIRGVNFKEIIIDSSYPSLNGEEGQNFIRNIVHPQQLRGASLKMVSQQIQNQTDIKSELKKVKDYFSSQYYGQWTTDTELNNKDECNHDWKVYQGFNKADEYCSKCDARRDLKS